MLEIPVWRIVVMLLLTNLASKLTKYTKQTNNNDFSVEMFNNANAWHSSLV